MKDLTRVFNCDCLPAMKEFPDKHFDLAIVDPPYGIGAASKTFIRQGKQTGKSLAVSGMRYKAKAWDESLPGSPYFLELQRVAKNQIIWGGNYFDLGSTSCYIVWDKVNGDNLYADCELAWTSFNSAVRQFTYKWHGLLQENMKDKEERIHPTQKPVALYKWLLKNYAKEGDKILDSHGGSMSSVIACLDMGFSITCYELDPDYYNAGKNRIINHLKQLNAFRPAYDIEFHDNSGVSELRNNAGIGYQEQKDGTNNNPVHRVDGLFHGDTTS